GGRRLWGQQEHGPQRRYGALAPSQQRTGPQSPKSVGPQQSRTAYPRRRSHPAKVPPRKAGLLSVIKGPALDLASVCRWPSALMQDPLQSVSKVQSFETSKLSTTARGIGRSQHAASSKVSAWPEWSEGACLQRRSGSTWAPPTSWYTSGAKELC